jgi:ABC-2 type transport system ATP-binding protein
VTLLLGLNAQGKTTLMKTLAGLLPPVDGKFTPTRALYLSDEVDFPRNLTPSEVIRCLDPKGKHGKLSTAMLAGLGVEDKKYGVLSRGIRQKARLVFAEVVSRVRNVKFLGIDEPFSGLDFEAREYLEDRWLQHNDPDRHLLISMHPSEIAVEPTQILLVSGGRITRIPGGTAWPEIKSLLQTRPWAAV